MKEDNFKVIQDKEASQFLHETENGTARIFYTIKEDQIYFDYVSVPYSLSGKGVGTKLVIQAQSISQEDGYEVVPVCGFAKFVLRNKLENL